MITTYDCGGFDMLDSRDELKDENQQAMMDIQSNNSLYRITTLGKFDVIKNGKSLVEGSGGSKKLWELYQFMFSNRERSFSPETLMDQLWTDADYSDPRSTLRRQMFRLRKLLGEDDIDENSNSILFKNGYYEWNSKVIVELDSDLFLIEIKKAENYLEQSTEHALIHYERGISLYQNDYLPQCNELHWVFPIRNKYRHMFVDAVVQTAELMKRVEKYRDLIALAEKAIGIDFYEEAFHYILIEAKWFCGEYKSIIDHYQHMLARFKQEMGIEPSRELKELYSKVTHSQQIITNSESINIAFDTKKEFKNAYYCEPSIFKAIFELELRKSERDGSQCSIGVITLDYNRKITIGQNDLYMKQLKNLLESHLRKGDAFTQWNSQQMVVLLFAVGRNMTVKVLERILEKENIKMFMNISQVSEISELK